MNSNRRFYRTPLRRRAFLSFPAALLLLLICQRGFRRDWRLTNVRPLRLNAGTYVVQSVVDECHLNISDLDGAEFRIRIIGICPPTKKESWRAAASNRCAQICDNKTVRIRLDKRRTDVDGSWLAHVYVDDELLSYSLVSEGLAVVKSNPSDSQTIIRRLNKAQVRAKQDRIGFWGLSIEAPNQIRLGITRKRTN